VPQARALLQALEDERVHERFLVRKVPVDSADPQAGGTGDVGHLGVNAELAQHPHARFQDRVAIALGVDPSRPVAVRGQPGRRFGFGHDRLP
jgi:hypothetical protein